MLSDERLTRRAAGGDERAFAAIYRRYHQDLYRYCLAILGDSQEAQDALQNTMVKVLRALPDERRPIRLKPWLYRIAHNESIDLVRGRRVLVPLDPELEAGGGHLAEHAERRDRLRCLLGDLDDLPERQRGALLLRELGGLGFAEIGEILATSPAAVRQTIYEARVNLAQIHAGRELTCRAVTRALSDADGRVTRRRDIRAHLRSCDECRAFGDEARSRRSQLAAIAPLPAVASSSVFQGAFGGGASTGAVTGTLGGGFTAPLLGGSVALKAAATVAVVAVLGVGAAERGTVFGGSHAAGSSDLGTRAAGDSARSAAVWTGGPSGLTSSRPLRPASVAAGAAAGSPAISPQRARPALGGATTATGSIPATAGQGFSGSGSGDVTGSSGAGGQQGGGASESSPDHTANPGHPAHPSPPAASPAADPAGQPATPPGKEKTPSGQEHTPPGQENTPPGQERAPPGQEGGQGTESTPPGQERTPPGQERTPPGLEHKAE